MTRAAVALVALVAAGFFVQAIVEARSAARVEERLADVAAQPSPAELRTTARLIDRVGRLSPGTRADLLRARLALQARQPAEARRRFLDVVRREPDNAEAWTAIAVAFERTDPRLAARAERELRRLVPPVPPP